MRFSGVFRPIYVLLVLAVVGVSLGLVVQPSRAATIYTVVTVRVVGLYSNVGTTVYVNSASKGTIYGEGVLTLIFANLTYSATVSVDDHAPNGYPYFGYPYYMYPGPSWGPYGQNGVSFICRSNHQRVIAGVNTTLTFRYDPMFFLYVKSNRGQPEGTGWYLAGTLARVAVASPVEEGAGTRYRFDKWTGGYMRDSGNSAMNFIYMDSPKMVEAVWVTQHRLTVNSLYGQPVGDGWYDKDQMATFSVTPSIEEAEGTRRVFGSWIGDYSGSSVTGSVVMSGPRTVTATWKTQYLLAVDPNGGQVDKTNQWLDSGSSVTVSASSPCSVVERKSQLVFAGWEGAATSSSSSVTLVIDGPKALMATWKPQYFLVVETMHGTGNGEGWYDGGAVAEFSVNAEVPMESPWGALGGKYVFNGWRGDLTASTPAASIVMDGAHSVTASWTGDYSSVIMFFSVVVAVVAAVAIMIGFRVGVLRWQREQSTTQTGEIPSKTNTSGDSKAAEPSPESMKKESSKA